MSKDFSTNRIRQIFLDYFQKKGHELVDSSSLVPSNDPSLLFTNAGMVPFKDMLLGVEKRSYTRAVSSQKCLRVGGKHNDLDNVGYTARHHTFFEMLGNFSFGDYFKEEAIESAWDLLTKRYNIPAEKLWITVHKDDQESELIWKEKIGIDPTRISRLDDDENFWTMGDTGPCGPCSEIYYDHGDHIEGQPPTLGSDPGDRFIEIWNLVFTQFNRSKDGTLSPLPNPCVDTGMGLERIAAVLQNEHNNYNTDLFKSLIREASKLTGETNLTNPSLRVIADHLRASAFLIAEDVVPSNEGRGYVLRRIIRRAIRHANKLGTNNPVLSLMVSVLVKEMGDAHPLIKKNRDLIKANLLQEEEQFTLTLEQGMTLLENEVNKLKGNIISGELAFKLYDTFGFPVDMTADFAREKNLQVDLDSYDELMSLQRERARAASNFSTLIPKSIVIEDQTQFIGYEMMDYQSTIIELVKTSKESKSNSLSEGEEGILFLKKTPFYAESGGQVGDQGKIIGDGFIFSVSDTKKVGDHFAHIGQVKKGNIQKNIEVKAEIDQNFRKKVTANHSATHLLQAALKEILGKHVEQKGSLVNSNKLRFDFTHPKSISSQDLIKIENLINNEMLKNTATVTESMSMAEAQRKGAIAFFGDKYGEEVRVLNLGQGFSVELCGGTHVKKTGDIGLIKIISESGISSGVRRIEALTGEGADHLLLDLLHTIATLSKELNIKENLQIKKCKGLEALNLIRKLQKEIKLASKELNTPSDQLVEKIRQLNRENKLLNEEINSSGAQEEIIIDQSNKLLDRIISLKNVNKILNSKLKTLKKKSVGTTISDFSDNLVEVLGYSLLTNKLVGLEPAILRETADELRNQIPNSIIILVSINGDKNPLVVTRSKELEDVDSRDIIKHLIAQLGGSGGGRPDLAQGGIDQPDELDMAFASIPDLLRNLST